MQSNSATRNGHVDGMHASEVGVGTVGMEEQGVTLRRGRGPTGGLEAESAGRKQLAPACIGTRDIV